MMTEADSGACRDGASAWSIGIPASTDECAARFDEAGRRAATHDAAAPTGSWRSDAMWSGLRT